MRGSEPEKRAVTPPAAWICAKASRMPEYLTIPPDACVISLVQMVSSGFVAHAATPPAAKPARRSPLGWIPALPSVSTNILRSDGPPCASHAQLSKARGRGEGGMVASLFCRTW
eukprot:scaffold374_cov271-Pinguiococcus_pyrenoidosus.AAC.10